MILIAITQNGDCFEATSKRDLVNQMIEHYGKGDLDNIERISCKMENGKNKELCKYAINRIQFLVDEGVEKNRKFFSVERQGFREIQSDYKASLL